jgi:hypothetical protein
MSKKDLRIQKLGVDGYNKPKRTPNHPTKSHVVLAKVGDEVKTVRFGQQGVKGAGANPGARKKSYYARHNAQDSNPPINWTQNEVPKIKQFIGRNHTNALEGM